MNVRKKARRLPSGKDFKAEQVRRQGAPQTTMSKATRSIAVKGILCVITSLRELACFVVLWESEGIGGHSHGTCSAAQQRFIIAHAHVRMARLCDRMARPTLYHRVVSFGMAAAA